MVGHSVRECTTTIGISMNVRNGKMESRLPPDNLLINLTQGKEMLSRIRECIYR